MSEKPDGIDAIFVAALEKATPEELSGYLDQACGNNSQLRERVEVLLQTHHEAGSFLEKPAFEVAAGTLSQETTDLQTDHATDVQSILEFFDPSEKSDCLGMIGQYEITDLIGRGGMGVVLKGYDPKLSRVVAVKVLAPELASNPLARRRFLREGRAAAAISHDHVITIYGIDDSTRLPLLAMEFVSGQSLQQRIDQEGGLELKEILRISKQAAEGLAAAHAEGLVHRDIKPANILLENGVERVKITDFGLARAVDDVRITQAGTVTGTPQYMSPEQARGEPVDARSDLFSLGCVLYAMCVGRPPFRSENTVGMIRRVCEDEPRPIREINSEIPEWLAGLVKKLLAKSPNDRIQSADHVAELLKKYLAHVQQPSTQPPPPVWKEGGASRSQRSRTQRKWLAAAAVLLISAISLGLAEAGGVTQIASTIIRVVRGDGTLVVEVADPEIEVQVDGEDLVITGAGPKEVRLHPGQHTLHATKDGEPVETMLITIQRGGREVVKVSRENSAGPGASEPDAKADSSSPANTLAQTDDSIVDETTGLCYRKIGNLVGEKDILTYSTISPTLSPDGTILYFLGGAAPLEGGEPVAISEGLAKADWSADGTKFAWYDKGIWALRVSRKTGQAAAKPEKIVEGEDNEPYGLKWSPDGTKIAYFGNGISVTPVSLETGQAAGDPENVVEGKDDYPGGVKWSQDSQKFIYKKDGCYWVYSFVNDRNLQVSKPVRQSACCWSPDGQTVAYFDDKERKVYLQPIDGSQPRELHFELDANDVFYPLGWLPNGWIFSTKADYVRFVRVADGLRVDAPRPSDVGTFIGLTPDNTRLRFCRNSRDHSSILRVASTSGGGSFNPAAGLTPLGNGTRQHASVRESTEDSRLVIIRVINEDQSVDYWAIPIGENSPFLLELDGVTEDLSPGRGSIAPGATKYLVGKDTSWFVVPMSVSERRASGAAVKVFDTIDKRYVSSEWSSDASKLSVLTSDSIWIAWSDGRPAIDIKPPDPVNRWAGVAWAPDDNAISFKTRPEKNVRRLWVYRVEDNSFDELVEVTNRDIQTVRWSPDGTTIGYILRDDSKDSEDGAKHFELFTVNVASKQVQRLFGVKGNLDYDWSKDGREIAFATQGKIAICSLDSGDTRELQVPQRSDYHVNYGIKYSPDGTMLSFGLLREPGGGDSTRLFLVRVEGGPVNEVSADNPSFKTSYSFSPDGKWLSHDSWEFVKVRPATTIWELDLGDFLECSATQASHSRPVSHN